MRTNRTAALALDWQTLLQSFDVSAARAEVAFAELIKAYASPDRYYHTLEHIQQVLQTVQQLSGYADNIAIVRLAAWFHDVVYDSRATDNEEKSADYARFLLSDLQVPTDAIAATVNLILQTKLHRAEQQDRDGRVLLDSDLAILGSDPQQYQRYARAIRQEYHWVPASQYRIGRKQVLEAFLQRQQIYYTAWMVEAAEQMARQNLQAEIQML